MENREMPILHNSQALGQRMPQMGLKNFFFAATSRQRKNLFLRDLCASVVKANPSDFIGRRTYIYLLILVIFVPCKPRPPIKPF